MLDEKFLSIIYCLEHFIRHHKIFRRAATLDNATDFMTTDYTQCCTPQKKKATDTPAGEPKKKRQRKAPTDPDYDPYKDREETESPQPSTSGYKSVSNNSVTPNVTINSEPLKAVDSNKNISVTQLHTNSNASSFKIGSTTFKSRTPTFTQSRPKLQVNTPGALNTSKFETTWKIVFPSKPRKNPKTFKKYIQFYNMYKCNSYCC